MSVYVFIEINITNPDWLKEYVEKVTPMVEKHGGKYLTKTLKAELVEGEGDLAQVITLVEFPSKESVLSFYNSKEYQPYITTRKSGSVTKITLIPKEGVST